MRNNLIRSSLLSVLREGQNFPQLPTTMEEQRAWLGDILIESNANWKEETLNLIDQLLAEELHEKKITSVKKDIQPILQMGETKLSVWRGDITTLSDTAIVNAANDQGLGCFVADHRCIDNCIHRAGGPRLRQACRTAMLKRARGRPLSVGTTPLVTPAFSLPSTGVIHVTGPLVPRGETLTRQHEKDLAKTYRNILNVAAGRFDSVAIPCISTGLFGFPADRAMVIALNTTVKWLENNPGELDSVVFNTFLESDEELYRQGLETVRNAQEPTIMNLPSELQPQPSNSLVAQAKGWIDNADAVLIVAGAGMSVKQGEMVYTNETDFAHHYPYFTKYGYKTGYEAMGLIGDRAIPVEAKWGYQAKHIENMRWNFAPNEGYGFLKELVENKDHFVLTSNVDACFERAGFDTSRIYTPQGEWTHLQCMQPCQKDSVFLSRPYLDKMIPQMDQDGLVPTETVPKCPRCGSGMFGNVRGGSWFLHDLYKKQNEALVAWMDNNKDKNVVVLEIGAGFNTPSVTRFPAEDYARQTGGRLIRINPTEPQVPMDINAIAFESGWEVLQEILETKGDDHGTAANQTPPQHLFPPAYARQVAAHYGGWRDMLTQLSSH